MNPAETNTAAPDTSTTTPSTEPAPPKAAKKPPAPKSQKHASLLAAFAAAQHEARTVEKRGHNDAGNNGRGYDYATAEDIIIEAKSILANHGLAVFPGKNELRPSAFSESAVELVAQFTLVHPSTGEERDLGERVWPVIAEHDRPFDRAWAGADTSLLAYFLRDLLQLPRVERGTGLDDGSRDEARRAQRQAQRSDENRRTSPPPASQRAGMGSGGGARRPGGNTRAEDVNVVRLTERVRAEYERLGIPTSAQKERSRSILGRQAKTASDLGELVRALRKMPTPAPDASSEQKIPPPTEPAP